MTKMKKHREVITNFSSLGTTIQDNTFDLWPQNLVFSHENSNSLSLSLSLSLHPKLLGTYISIH